MTALLAAIRFSVRTRAELEIEIVALRHQLAVLQQAAPRRLRLSRADRLPWVLLSRVWRQLNIGRGWPSLAHVRSVGIATFSANVTQLDSV